jgi:hypothetical protein
MRLKVNIGSSTWIFGQWRTPDRSWVLRRVIVLR